ncbi:hypothetical protein CVT26_013884 [Gymnopilus dilepis]|uniref:Cytochrome P450 n=1 Tax=Gymnopilus dilepis TaxID=231916 RepID=A0A409Y6A0_9AGAR|nr:hypothetical protein CVT26_013884 [Gymnopilus dilepis]
MSESSPPAQFDVSMALPSLLVVILAIGVYYLLSPKDKSSIRRLGGFPIVTAWAFFSRRYDFLWKHFKSSDTPHFKFQVLQHHVVALRGEESRRKFFDSRTLNFAEGYKILMGASPNLKDINVDALVKEESSWFVKRLPILLNRKRLEDMLPLLLADVENRTQTWGKKGRFDPFKNIYDLVFQMTVRMATCREFAQDIQAVDEVHRQFWILEKSATPTRLLLPWFPGPARRRNDAATKELYMTLYTVVEKRRAAETPSSDAIDLLIAEGFENGEIIQFILAVIFAGVVNTGLNACWALVFLAAHPEWKTKVKAEIEALIAKHTDTVSPDPLHKRLAAIPISAWEDEMPILESVIRESLRLAFNSALLRRNLSEPFTVAGGTIEKGDFLTYSVADVHLNPEIYTRPQEFDPLRFGPGREEDKKHTYAFLGWGAGRHPCAGMKVAKLEIKVIMAVMLAGYDFDVVDVNGKRMTNLPQPDRNDIHQARPVGETCYFQFDRIAE